MKKSILYILLLLVSLNLSSQDIDMFHIQYTKMDLCVDGDTISTTDVVSKVVVVDDGNFINLRSNDEVYSFLYSNPTIINRMGFKLCDGDTFVISHILIDSSAVTPNTIDTSNIKINVYRNYEKLLLTLGNKSVILY